MSEKNRNINSYLNLFKDLNKTEQKSVVAELQQSYPEYFEVIDKKQINNKNNRVFVDKKIDFISEISSEQLPFLFSFLDGFTLLTMLEVNKSWNSSLKHININKIWEREFRLWFPGSRFLKTSINWLNTWFNQLKIRRIWLKLSNKDKSNINKWEFLGHNDRVRHVKIRGDKFVSASWDNTIRLGNVKNLAHETKLIVKHRKSVFGVWFDGNIVASCSEDFDISIYNIELNKIVQLKGHQRSVYRIEVLGSILISCGSDFIGVWNWKKNILLQKLKGHTKGFDVHRLQVCNQHIITGSYDGTVRIWNFKILTSTQVNIKSIWKSPNLHRGGVSALHVSGNLVGSGSAYGDIFIFDISKKKLIFRQSNNNSSNGNGEENGIRNENKIVTCVLIAEALGLFVCSSIASFYSGNGHVCFWDIKTSTCVQVIKQNSYINSFTFKYGILFSAESDGSVRVRDLMNDTFPLIAQEKLSKGQLFDVDVQDEAMVACGLDRVFLIRPLL